MPTQRDPDAPQPPEANAPRWQIEPLSPPHDGLLLPALHAVADPLIQRGRDHGPLPKMRTDAFLDAHPDQQLACLLIAGYSAVIADPHTAYAALLKGASSDVSVGYRNPRAADTLSLVDRWKETARQAEQRADAEKRARLDAEARLRDLTTGPPTPRPADTNPTPLHERAARRRRTA